jgi:hypothetical protein
LTRYQFRNVIEGRPAYDDVTLVNGSRIEEPPAANRPEDEGGPEPERTCSALAGSSSEQVAASASARGAG